MNKFLGNGVFNKSDDIIDFHISVFVGQLNVSFKAVNKPTATLSVRYRIIVHISDKAQNLVWHIGSNLW